jgi:hypothetical protein
MNSLLWNWSGYVIPPHPTGNVYAFTKVSRAPVIVFSNIQIQIQILYWNKGRVDHMYLCNPIQSQTYNDIAYRQVIGANL